MCHINVLLSLEIRGPKYKNYQNIDTKTVIKSYFYEVLLVTTMSCQASSVFFSKDPILTPYNFFYRTIQFLTKIKTQLIFDIFILGKLGTNLSLVRKYMKLI
jgi:hypothetical protein